MSKRSIAHAVVVEASPEEVWAALQHDLAVGDLDALVEGTIAPAAVVGSERTSPKSTVLRNQHARELRLRGRLLNSNLLFVGEHYYMVEPLGPRFTRFTQGKVFKGMLLPLVGGAIRSARQEFRAFNMQLKRRTEALKSAVAQHAA